MCDEAHHLFKNQDNVKFLSGENRAIFLVHNNFIYKRFNGHKPKNFHNAFGEKFKI